MVFSNTLVNQGPSKAVFAQDLVLRVNKYNCCVTLPIFSELPESECPAEFREVFLSIVLLS
jgi:hypothetical protein